jgi:hypothetical protein
MTGFERSFGGKLERIRSKFKRMAKRTSRAMTLPFDQARLVPPHWRARRRQMREGRGKEGAERVELEDLLLWG